MTGPQPHPALGLLMQNGPPRVWSLIVTLFGDLAQAEGAVISGAVLSSLCGQIGIKPEALRVALHRLRQDGWIESHKRGRARDYGLSAMGLQQSRSARPHIYADKGADEADWHLVLCGGPEAASVAENLAHGGRHITLPGHLLVLDRPPDGPFAAQVVSGRIEGELPDWLQDSLLPEGVAEQTDQLNRALSDLEALDLSGLGPTERAALRILIVHEWRRIALRLPALPDRFFPRDWPGPSCRSRVANRLAALPRLRLEDLEEAASEAA